MASRWLRLGGTQADYGFGVIVALVAAVTVWLVAMPFFPSVARATLARFHLRTDSFLGWAIQQPVPAMYNFANRYRVDGSEDVERGGSSTTTAMRVSGTPIESGFINHFPTRLFSFADARYRLLHDGEPRRYEFVSTYRGEAIESRYVVTPGPDGDLRVLREYGGHAKRGQGSVLGRRGHSQGEREERLKHRGTEDTERGVVVSEGGTGDAW